jgi:hypothetical protein
MEELEKTLLVTLINLDSKLRANDQTVMTEVAYIKNHVTSQDQKNQLSDILTNAINDSDGSNQSLIIAAVNELDVQNKDYLLLMANIPVSPTKEEMAIYLNSILGKQITITDKQKEYMFYSRCVHMAIASKDNALIQKMIQKIQSL